MADNVHDGHRQRLKERFLAEGLDNFTDHQILEFLLFYALRRRDTNELAHRLLNTYGTLHSLFDANANDIRKTCGLSMNTAILLSLIPHIARRYATSKWEGRISLNTITKAGEFCISLFTGKIYETFYLISMDNQHKLLASTVLSEGSVSETPVYPRLVIEMALRFQASCVILTHNHPGGSLKPSQSDVLTTNKIAAALEMISITLVDHIIVAGDQYYSLSEHNYLKVQNKEW